MRSAPTPGAELWSGAWRLFQDRLDADPRAGHCNGAPLGRKQLLGAGGRGDISWRRAGRHLLAAGGGRCGGDRRPASPESAGLELQPGGAARGVEWSITAGCAARPSVRHIVRASGMESGEERATAAARTITFCRISRPAGEPPSCSAGSSRSPAPSRRRQPASQPPPPRSAS